MHIAKSDTPEMAMKMYYDEKSDALYLRFDNSQIVESEEVQLGIVLDYNDNNQVVGVEILRVKEGDPAGGFETS